jgi:hypothetical protein
MVYVQHIDAAGKVPRKWSSVHSSCTSCHNICCIACVLSIFAVSVHAGVYVMHSSVIFKASFSELASRTHPMWRNGMSARHHTSCTVSAMVDLVRFMSRALRLSQHGAILNRVFGQNRHTPHSVQHIRCMAGIYDAVHNSK